jgi:hypothetical protein
MDNQETKRINFGEPLFKDKEKERKITTTSQWVFTEDDLLPENQIHHLTLSNSPRSKLFQSLIRKKISSYRSQDIEKGIYNVSNFVDFDDVMQLFQNSISCFYCREPVLLAYYYARDPKQWTLERIDNANGHNKGNVTIACLRCNLRRRTIHYERYLATKQMMVVVKCDYI